MQRNVTAAVPASIVEFSARLNPPARLGNTAETLRDRFPERERFLGSFSTAIFN